MTPLVYVVMANDMPERVFDTLEVAQAFSYARQQENLSRRPPIFWGVYQFKVQSTECET